MHTERRVVRNCLNVQAEHCETVCEAWDRILTSESRKIPTSRTAEDGVT